MDRNSAHPPADYTLRILGWTVLVLAIPLALFAALHPPNEYKATLGINALDCDGPLGTYLFAAPALVIYGIGLVGNGWRCRRPANAVVALLCAAICVAVTINVGLAMREDQRQAADCELLNGSRPSPG